MIDVIYSPLHEDHHPTVYMWHDKPVDYIESPQRMYSILKELTARNMARVKKSHEYSDDLILAVHNPLMVDFLRQNTLEMVTCAERPDIVLKGGEALHFSHGTYRAVKAAVDCALSGADIIVSGKADRVYCLCRPPGHHASTRKMGGFCFLNNAAIAASGLISQGKVAVLDIDRHHGNGTQDILYDEDEAIYLSLNARGTYPIGLDGRQSPEVNNDRIINFNIEPEASDADYLAFVTEAIDRVKAQRIDVLVVSAGFDTSENEFPDLDDVGAMKLTRGCFHSMGKIIRDAKIPVLVVQEGGYNTDSLGKDVSAFLEGME